jgi:hypothetical protein
MAQTLSGTFDPPGVNMLVIKNTQNTPALQLGAVGLLQFTAKNAVVASITPGAIGSPLANNLSVTNSILALALGGSPPRGT